MSYQRKAPGSGDPGSSDGPGGGAGQATSRIGRWLRVAGGLLFREQDTRARQNGWQVSIRQAGLGRQYRDPRFDLLARCGSCAGIGRDGVDQPCETCSGTGRIRRSEPVLPKGGR